jgi:hypothetical protein
MNKQTIIAVLGTLVTVFIALLIVGLLVPDETQVATSDIIYDGFMEGCIEEGASTRECSCMYEVLEGEHGRSGIVQAGLQLSDTGEIDEGFYDKAINECY